MTFTTFTNGTLADADEVNDNFSEVTIHRKVYSSAAEISTTGTSFADTTKTFDLSAPVGAIIIGLSIRMQLKNSTTRKYTTASVKIAGTNLGTLYLQQTKNYPGSTIQTSVGCITSTTEAGGSGDDEAAIIMLQDSTDYADFYHSATLIHPLKILDASTTFTIRFAVGDGTGYMKNVVVEVLYVNRYIED